MADTGVGIPPEQIERIFDRFAQVDDSATRQHEGTGIGLSLVRELVELHGGRVWAESAGLGHGARRSTSAAARRGGRRRTRRSCSRAGAHGEAARALDRGDGGGARRTTASCAGGSARRSRAQRRARRGRDDGRDRDGDRIIRRARPRCWSPRTTRRCGGLLVHLLGRRYRVRSAPNGRLALEAARATAPRRRRDGRDDARALGHGALQRAEGRSGDAAHPGGARDLEGRARDEDRGARARRRRLRDEAVPSARAPGAGRLAGADRAAPGGPRRAQRRARGGQHRARARARAS